MQCTRGNVVRHSSATFRKCEVKYSTSPYDFYPLCFPPGKKFSEEFQELCAQAQHYDQDVYAIGINMRFYTPAKKRGVECQRMLRAATATTATAPDAADPDPDLARRRAPPERRQQRVHLRRVHLPATAGQRAHEGVRLPLRDLLT